MTLEANEFRQPNESNNEEKTLQEGVRAQRVLHGLADGFLGRLPEEFRRKGLPFALSSLTFLMQLFTFSEQI